MSEDAGIELRNVAATVALDVRRSVTNFTDPLLAYFLTITFYTLTRRSAARNLCKMGV